MSAFIVSHTTIDHVVLAWALVARSMGDSVASSHLLGRKLLEMNCAAVDGRYREENPREAYNFTLTDPPSYAQIAKSVACFLYQCCEGNISESSLYKATQAVEKRFEKLARAQHGKAYFQLYSDAKWD